MAIINLENEFLQVVLNPEHGASVLKFLVKKDKDWISLMPDSQVSFLMIPYSNRIENGTFSFEGKQYQLANKEKHAIHGDVRIRNWSIKNVSSDYICCEFDSNSYSDINWPWSFKVCVEYQLIKNVFCSRLILLNQDKTTMPAGLGWHPYFNRNLTQKQESVFLSMKVKSAYPDAYNNRIPSGYPIPLTSEQDFSTEKLLNPNYFLDTCFYGYDGNGYISWPKTGIKLNFQCSACTHLVIYTPLEQPYFAVEPVTNANNGINFYTQNEFQSGIISLSPKKIFEATFKQEVNILK